MGIEKIDEYLPRLIDGLTAANVNFILLCDPCHANTKTIKGFKTRYLETILEEITKFFSICKSKNIYAGGVHLEISGSPLTECIGQDVQLEDLEKNYQTKVDPRLNNMQTLKTAFHIASLN